MPRQQVVEVEWHLLKPDDPEWDADFCLYAYLHPDTDRILYIGKADHQTVWERMHGPHKDELFDDLYRATLKRCVNSIGGDYPSG